MACLRDVARLGYPVRAVSAMAATPAVVVFLGPVAEPGGVLRDAVAAARTVAPVVVVGPATVLTVAAAAELPPGWCSVLAEPGWRSLGATAVLGLLAAGYHLVDSRLVARTAGGCGPGRRGLTDRQLEVARLVARGLTNDAIAARLFITPRTVKFHIAQILGRVELRDRAQLVAHVYRSGLL